MDLADRGEPAKKAGVWMMVQRLESPDLLQVPLLAGPLRREIVPGSRQISQAAVETRLPYFTDFR